MSPTNCIFYHIVVTRKQGHVSSFGGVDFFQMDLEDVLTPDHTFGFHCPVKWLALFSYSVYTGNMSPVVLISGEKS